MSLLLILIFTLGTTMSGNRIPLIMYFLSLILITVFEKFFRKDLIIISLIILVATFGYIKHNDNEISLKNKTQQLEYLAFPEAIIKIFR